MKTTARLAWLVGIVIILCGAYYFYATHPGQKTLTPVRAAVAQGAMTEIVARLMIAEGIDKKYGLAVTFDFPKPGDFERNVLNGDYDITTIGPETVMKGEPQGVNLKVIGTVMPVTYLVIVPNDSPIQTLNDIKGKKMAMLPKTTSAYNVSAVALRAAGIDPDKDLYLAYGDLPSTISRLESGEVDASITAYPLAAGLLSSGKYRVVDSFESSWQKNEHGLPLPFVVMSVENAWYQSHPAETAAYLKAWYETVNMIKTNPKIVETLTSYLATNHLNTPQATKLLEQNIMSDLFTTWNTQGVQAVQLYASKLKQYGLVDPKLPDITPHIVSPSALGF